MHNRTKGILTLLLRAAALLVLLLVGVSAAIAQTSEYTGFMGDDVPDDLYEFDLLAGDTLYAELVATDGELDPVLILEDEDGNELDMNDDRGDGSLNSEITYTAEGDETVVVRVTNYPDTEGEYRLTVTITPAGGTPPEDNSEGTQAQTAPGEIVEYTGYMAYNVPDDVYEVELQAGQTIIVEAYRVDGDLDPVVAVRDSEGNIVAQNDDREPGNLDSRLEYTAEESGTYEVIMSNYGKTAGDYRLTIEVLGEGEVVAGETPDETTEEENAEEAITGDAEEAYSGFVDDENRDEYPVTLEAGQAVVVRADATDVNLDTLLILLDESGEEVAINDDRESGNLNSTLVYIAPEAGTYTVVMTNYSGTSGNYELTIDFVTAEEALPLLEAGREELSGPMLIYDTEHFRIHYTLEGVDATTEEFVREVGETMEEVRTIQLAQLGWAEPMRDGQLGGDDRFDVYLIELLDNPDRGELGTASPEVPIGDNPDTDFTEEGAAANYLTLDDDYAEAEGEDPIALMRATAAHEHHHAVQFGYEANEPHFWYYEATASWMETITVPEEEDATRYVESVYQYPEVCFGAEGDADPSGGILMYGSWLFLDALQDWYGEEAPIKLWDNIARYDGWEALTETLAAYNDTLPAALARYHATNLVRDYDFAPVFSDYTVWQENVIDEPGEWTFTGQGIQELAANYFEVALDGGLYGATIGGDDGGNLELYAIGINGDKADVIPLGRGGAFDTSAYELTYLMVFNPDYDDDLSDCRYLDYQIEIQTTNSLPNAVAYSLDATNFESLD
ncbi:MAG: PPC domain-containing protein [bacterium]|nr:PPC domain-containing protein [bacterium]